VFVICFVCLCPVSCVLDVANVSGMSILYCTSVFSNVYRYFIVCYFLLGMVTLLEQELLILPQLMCTTPVICGGSCCSIFSFLCNVLQIIVCPFSFGHCIVHLYSPPVFGGVCVGNRFNFLSCVVCL
jgi:hypothetical protein